jgi:anti-anti-sigma regulatory factor
MENSLNIKKEAWVTIFEIHWYLDETNAAQTFEKIHEAIWDFTKDTKLIFNFSWLNYLNSKSIWYTADIISHVDDNEWGVFISNCSDTVKDTLELVWITNMVTIVEDYKEAIEELNK